MSDYTNVKILDLALNDRPREKAMRNGIGTLSDAELIAILLRDGLPGFSVLDMSRSILQSTGNSLQAIGAMTPTEMTRKFKGVGEAKAVTLAAAFELGMRYSREIGAEIERRKAAPRITSSADAHRFIRERLYLLPHEEFWIIMLSRANTIIGTHCVSRGGMTSTVVDVRLIMHTAINHLAAGIILVHNHPSGNLTPSVQDDSLTRRIVEAGKLLEIKVLDHLIVAADGYYSYNDEGHLTS